MNIPEDMTPREFGREFTKGVLDRLILVLICMLIFGLPLDYVITSITEPTDDTDKSMWNRSGMKLYTDNATGVQYLSNGNGGLTPRLQKEESK